MLQQRAPTHDQVLYKPTSHINPYSAASLQICTCHVICLTLSKSAFFRTDFIYDFTATKIIYFSYFNWLVSIIETVIGHCGIRTEFMYCV